MKNVLVIGAGRSASSLIRYLLDHSESENWNVTVGDVSLEMAQQKAGGHARARAIAFDIHNTQQKHEEIQKADLVISMLPAVLHLAVAKDCVRFKKHLVTASYVSKDIAALDAEAKSAGIILMNEIGLDPGIDHASAMKVIDHVKKSGGEVVAFRSYCGGLVAPECNDNPWGYKFTWNPRNVVLAGQGGDAQFIENGKLRSIPYEKLFLETETVEVQGHGSFEAYANRDSLSYRQPYGLENIPTMLRGTLRMPGYCKAWNAIIKLGLTYDSEKLEGSEKLTWRQLIEALNPDVRFGAAAYLGEEEDSEVMKKLEWLEIFSDREIDLVDASPAEILQQLLEEKWKLKANDHDMIVMQHEFEIKAKNEKEEKRKKIISALVVKGEDQIHTAMAKTVGLPAAITSKLILQGKIKARGVVIPTIREIYEPVLNELETYGIKFEEREVIV
ncbi:MAG TPA: saccharopine dehydrogenase C-terminal domain-containing protein [Bacteroidia bacterium]|jgi:saccharopine dehydrogenase-like NADP-dependent oxidoreductase